MASFSTIEHESANDIVTAPPRRRRGFAVMSPEKQREIASKGGRAAHEQGTAHEWTVDEARSASQKSGHVKRHREAEGSHESESESQ